MVRRLALATALLIVTYGCGQSTSPSTSTTSPSPSCAYSLSINETINGYPNGGNFTVAVTTMPATGCAWTAVSNASWIHVTQGSSGSGSGTFAFTADANTGAARTGTLTAAGRLITFNQTATATTPSPSPTPSPACTFKLSINNTINGYPTGGNFAVGITAGDQSCGWTAVSHASWIHVTSGASGTGDGAMTFTADPNPGDKRTGTLTIAGEIVTFNQSEK